MDAALKQVLAYGDKDAAREALKTLRIYLGNILQYPLDQKYQSINTANKAFVSRVAIVDGTYDVLTAAGFEPDGDKLVMKMPNLGVLGEAVKDIDELIATGGEGPPRGQVNQIKTDAQYKRAVEAATASNSLIVIDFFAEWCGPCKFMSPVLEQLAQQHTNVIFLKIDVDDHQTEIGQGISSMPTFYFVKGGQVVDKTVGANQAELQQKVSAYM
eukprot:TRINITY_DN15730_c0_g1_i1.p1 TRINITY_DN15730_c0_g1~~TRINITY_DN15730_c0_g1_i1.p1  ORF type:complete len:225 (+),score=32.99 TRINITY_DN15730_c0_g1_i1:34-675(+)